jgi:hypothetical protein
VQLPADQVERFYAIWKPLLLFVNRRLKLVPEMLPADFSGPWLVPKVKVIRDALWADDTLLDAFVAKNPAKLSAADLALAASWKDRREGKFFILRHLKRYSIFIGGDPQAVYGVLGLASTLDEVVPFVPCIVDAVLLPFEDHIIYDSLIVPYNVMVGPGYRADLEETYRDAKERGAVLTSLKPVSPEDAAASAAGTNTKVLAAFRAHLYATGLSPKVVERDLANLAAFGETHLLALAQPRSLRDIGPRDVKNYLAELPAARRKEFLTGVKRFFKFLGDTDRMDYGRAQNSLKALRKLE